MSTDNIRGLRRYYYSTPEGVEYWNRRILSENCTMDKRRLAFIDKPIRIISAYSENAVPLLYLFQDLQLHFYK
jgi:hypothetical protein